MKHFLFILIISTAFTACKQTPQTEETADTTAQIPAMPMGKDTLLGPQGADAAKFQEVNDVTIYEYPNFKIRVEYAEMEDGSAGESITLVRNDGSDSTLISRKGFNFFYGVADNYLFVDEGTYDLGRTMHIYDINTNQEIGKFDFDDAEVILQNNQISFFVLLDDNAAAALKPKPKCDKEQEIKEAGLGLGYTQKYIFDLTTRKATPTKEYSCRAIS